MDAIQQAVVDAVVGLIGTVGEQSELFVVGLFLALGGWLKGRFSTRHQEQATLQAALETERWAQDEVAASREKPTSAAKKARTIRNARAALPLLHKPLLPGAHGRKVERVMPAVRRLSAPPPTRDAN